MKLLIVDEEYLFIGSHNWSNAAFREQNEATVLIKSKQLSNECVKYLKNIKWGDRKEQYIKRYKFNCPDKIKIFANYDYYISLANDIDNAEKNIDIVMYVMSIAEKKDCLVSDLIKKLINKVKSGIKVRGLLNLESPDRVQLNNSQLRTLNYLKENGVEVKFDSAKVVTHCKIVVIDNKITYIGSHNWSMYAFTRSLELSVRMIDKNFINDLNRYLNNIFY